jgi:crotonobetainyl-CoA:carnitine CoA-transferase CaiB-like acyl-CoA transferase
MYALEGITLLDFGQYLAGPFGPMVLGDLGANVIKVEPVRGDGMRPIGGPFFGCQRGKRDIALDVKSPDGIAIAHRLVESADMVHHNMTQGVAARLALDYETLKAIKPDLIYCNTWAYGEEGPLSASGGLDPLYQAACGLEYEAGAVHEGNPPLYIRFGMTDTANAFLSALALITALYHRKRTGQGQYLWTSLLNGAAMFSSDAFLVQDGEQPRRLRLDKQQTGLTPLYRLYETQEGWIQLAAVTDTHRAALAAVVGRDDLSAESLEEVFRGRTAQVWARALDAAGVPAEVAVDTLTGESVLFDADLFDAGVVTEYEHPIVGRLRQFGELIGFSETPGNIQGPPPLVGQHTREILLEAGYDDAEIDAFKEKGVVYEPDDAYPWPT